MKKIRPFQRKGYKIKIKESCTQVEAFILNVFNELEGIYPLHPHGPILHHPLTLNVEFLYIRSHIQVFVSFRRHCKIVLHV